jgi:hypothetical protein
MKSAGAWSNWRRRTRPGVLQHSSVTGACCSILEHKGGILPQGGVGWPASQLSAPSGTRNALPGCSGWHQHEQCHPLPGCKLATVDTTFVHCAWGGLERAGAPCGG